MSIEGGPFFITPLTPDGSADDLFIMRNGLPTEPLTLDARNPSVTGRQNWKVTKVGGPGDLYTLTSFSDEREGFSWIGVNPPDTKNSPVILNIPKFLILAQVGPEPFIYHIQAHTSDNGLDRFVDFDAESKQVQFHPTLPSEAKRMWRFERILD
ncbi:hypothetical protein BD779DRAFT_1476225 [Infundibulicybe gibba]|nr:hypothetical protein BD779DRAFT_1476225 [Infundibulicybe gibba]